QPLLLCVQLPQHAIQRLRGCRQSLRRRHHLLHHLFVHSFFLPGLFRKGFPCVPLCPLWLRLSLNPSPSDGTSDCTFLENAHDLLHLPQLDPRREIRRFIPPQHRRSRKGHPVQHPHACLDVFHQRIRNLVRHSKPRAGSAHIPARASQSRRPWFADLRHDLRKILRIQETADLNHAPHNFRSRDHPNLPPRVVPIQRRRVIQPHPHQRWNRRLRCPPSQQHSMPPHARRRLVR